jgi:hypothetical protein
LPRLDSIAFFYQRFAGGAGMLAEHYCQLFANRPLLYFAFAGKTLALRGVCAARKRKFAFSIDIYMVHTISIKN